MKIGRHYPDPTPTALELRRVPTEAERLIPARRDIVWAAVEGEDVGCQSHDHVVGRPTFGVGSQHLVVGPPLPPFGLHTVMLCEVTGMQEGTWTTSRTLGGAWEHTETLFLFDADEDQTIAKITGVWTKPAGPDVDFSELQAGLNGLAAKALDRLAEKVATGL